MLNKIIALTLLLSLFSCSTMKKTVLSSAITGATIGGLGGRTFSPDKESQGKNTFIFALLGAGIGALGGYLLHDKPQGQKLQKEMILDQNKVIEKEIPLFDFSPELKEVHPKISFKPVKKYEVPLTKLPKALQGKVKKQFVMEYVTEPKTIMIGKKTIQIDSFKAWEHIYEE